jgi:hypothetical protein
MVTLVAPQSMIPPDERAYGSNNNKHAYAGTNDCFTHIEYGSYSLGSWIEE